MRLKIVQDEVDSLRGVTYLEEMSWPIALMKFLSAVTLRLGIGDHCYVVGGAPRNFLLNVAIKDLDIVLDPIASGEDSEWLAKELQGVIPTKTSLVVNQYGVSILSVSGPWLLDGFEMKGQVIEIANARRESYDPAQGGKGYKPHLVEKADILSDLARRDFTVNTLLYRLSDLRNGPEGAPVLDLLGRGLGHLEAMELHTPQDPDKTFSDDPTRMLRAVRFIGRYGFELPEVVERSIIENAPKLKQMPWNAIQEILVRDILFGPRPREMLELMHTLGLAKVIKELLEEEPGFASGVGRFLSDVQDLEVIFDILDLGWKVKNPVSFLSRDDQLRLRAVENNGQLFRMLVKPPINQPALFAEFGLEGQDRARVLQIARQKLLESPSLAMDPSALETAVRTDLAARR